MVLQRRRQLLRCGTFTRHCVNLCCRFVPLPRWRLAGTRVMHEVSGVVRQQRSSTELVEFPHVSPQQRRWPRRRGLSCRNATCLATRSWRMLQRRLATTTATTTTSALPPTLALAPTPTLAPAAAVGVMTTPGVAGAIIVATAPIRGRGWGRARAARGKRRVAVWLTLRTLQRCRQSQGPRNRVLDRNGAKDRNIRGGGTHSTTSTPRSGSRAAARWRGVAGGGSLPLSLLVGGRVRRGAL